jgi:hypothetical protein
VNGPNYSVFRNDRVTDTTGGGVSIFVKNDKVSVATVTIPIEYSHFEIIAVDILNCPTKTRLFVCYYRPPSHDIDLEAKSYIADLCMYSTPHPS